MPSDTSASLGDEVDQDGTGYEIVTVRQNTSGEHDTGISIDSEPPSIRDIGDYGCGELKSAALEEICDHVDINEYDVGTAVATIYYDLDAWSYSIEYNVSVTPTQRIADYLEKLRWSR